MYNLQRHLALCLLFWDWCPSFQLHTPVSLLFNFRSVLNFGKLYSPWSEFVYIPKDWTLYSSSKCEKWRNYIRVNFIKKKLLRKIVQNHTITLNPNFHQNIIIFNIVKIILQRLHCLQYDLDSILLKFAFTVRVKQYNIIFVY